MPEFDVCTMGAATLNATTNVVNVEMSRETGLDGEYEPLGTAPMISCLGVTALPVGPSSEGHAEGIIMMPCGPYVAAIVGGTDSRCADVVGQMAPGDMCVHNTGGTATTRSRLFCKDNLLALLVGNDTTVVIDRTNKAITINDAFGNQFEMSQANGILMAEAGGAWIQLKDGKLTMAQSGLNLAGAVSIGDATAMPVAHSTPIVSYMSALSTLLTAWATIIDAKLAASPAATTALTAFQTATSALPALIPTIYTKAS